MTIHYHRTPITPRAVLDTLSGKHFCVSFAAPQDVEYVHKIGQSVMLDNGAYSLWKLNPMATDYYWPAFWKWAEQWLDYPTTWLVIPDVINGSEFANNELMYEGEERFRHKHSQIAPVWHIHEPIGRLRLLMHKFERVCFGSSGQFATIGNAKWNNRINEVFNEICHGTGSPPCWIHMLRGMSLAGSIYPFASVDSTDVARNHNRGIPAREMADKWDALQCPAVWKQLPVQDELTETIYVDDK